PLSADLERPALLVGDQDAMVDRIVLLQQAPQGRRGREADIGDERYARLDFPTVGLAPLAHEQVVGRQFPRLLPRPFAAAEGVLQPVARAMAQQRLHQAREIARVWGEAPGLEPVLCDLLLDLAVDRRVDEALDVAPRLFASGYGCNMRPTLDPGGAPEASEPRLLHFPGVAGPGQDVARPELQAIRQLLLEPV